MRTHNGPERLRVYELALRLAAGIDELIQSGLCAPSFADQMLRAVNSIIFNIGEGYYFTSAAMKTRHYEIARGSAGEVLAGLDRFRRRHPHYSVRALRSDCKMVIIMLTSLIGTYDERRDA